jgi:uncharacterized protein YndB with AHSA1/START domain
MAYDIDKQIDLKASVARVWKALTDHREFGQWFGVDLERPFEVGRVARGRITRPPGYEHLILEATCVAMEPERLFAYTWHPYAVDPAVDYSMEPQTRVEFRLEAIEGGTRLRITESGFDKIPAGRRALALRMNDGGWATQIENIERHVAP